MVVRVVGRDELAHRRSRVVGDVLQGRHLAGERLLRGGVDLADALVTCQGVKGGLRAGRRVVADGRLPGLRDLREVLRLCLCGSLRLGCAYAVRGVRAIRGAGVKVLWQRVTMRRALRVPEWRVTHWRVTLITASPIWIRSPSCRTVGPTMACPFASVPFMELRSSATRAGPCGEKRAWRPDT